jgi:hypothetical protein
MPKLVIRAGGLWPALPALFVLAAVATAVAKQHPATTDFGAFWHSGRAVLDGRSPYPPAASLPAVAHRLAFLPFVYPAPAALALAPFALLPFGVANLLWLALGIAAVALALRLLGVTDWRCAALVYASFPADSALAEGTFSPLLLLAVAAAWRWRDHAHRCGAAVAAAVVCKLFLWPLVVWLVLTRRLRAAAAAAALATVSVAAAWVVLGFEGLRGYPALLGKLTSLVGPNSFSLFALGRSAGVGSRAAEVVPFVLAVAVAAAFARRGDRAGICGALAATLVATPILWPHYLMLLVVPLALAAPSFGALWFAPSLLWLDAHPWSYGRSGRIAFELALALSLCAAPYARSVASTSSAWVSGFTLRMTRFTSPFSSMTNVDRSTPM